MAVTQGKSLKKFIESILISKANSINLEVTENPSPSNDPWFADPENIAIVEKGLEQAKNGDVRTLSVDELQNLLGV